MEESEKPTKRDTFARVALWQFMAFAILLCFVWTQEFLDLPHLLFDAPASPFSLYRAFTLSCAVITVGIIAVGHVYQQQREVVTKLLRTCLYCHRVRTDKGTWEHLDVYVAKHFPMESSNEACPDCGQMLADVRDHTGASANSEDKDAFLGLAELLPELAGTAETVEPETGSASSLDASS